MTQNSKDAQVQSLIKRLQELQLEQDSVIKEINETLTETDHQETKTNVRDPQPYKVGDYVIFTNNYRSEKHLTGRVIKVNPKSVKVSTKKGDRTKLFSNIKRIPRPQE